MNTRTAFNPLFDLQLMSVNQSKFEEWFAIMAEYIFGADFERIKAGGKKGDKKCDGRRISTETIYQCYAPESPATFAKKAPDKISDSFPHILDHWPNTKEWFFVHNNVEGLTTNASDRIEDIRQKYPKIKISTGTRSFLKSELHDKLSLQQLADVYPKAALNVEGVKMEHVGPLLKRIIEECSESFGSLDFGEIPDEAKLDFNQLLPASKFDIKRARPKVDVVTRYFDHVSNPGNVSIIQNAMRNKYADLVGFGYNPDEVLGYLFDFVCNSHTSEHKAASHVIVTYFFDTCDIFKNVPVDPC